MANFKLELLTHVTNRDLESYYLVSPIADFLDIKQSVEDVINPNNILQPGHYNFSFDEKFSLHANAQKELTFSMTDKIMYNNEGMDNPYAHNIHIGSQLLLTDKYHHQYLMTVSDISLQIQELNIKYQYTCQDSFSYQAMNQNQGYTIDNDIESANFLGAHNIDYGSKKITEECYHTYTFLDTHHGLYINHDGLLKMFIDEESDNYDSLTAYSQLSDVKKIIKPIYTDDYFQQLFTFSCSDSNAVAALISLGEKIDCVIRTYESLSTDDKGLLHLEKYCGFEPKRNPNPTGLKYTPNINLQSFNFSLKGSNLASVLNITPNHIGDDVISIFPTLPAFFQNGFQTTDGINSTYTTHMFSQKLRGIQKELIDNDPKHPNPIKPLTTIGENLYGCEIDHSLFAEKYPIINFNQDNNYSIISNISSKNTIYKIFLPYIVTNNTSSKAVTIKYLIIEDHQQIPAWWFSNYAKNKDLFIDKNIYVGLQDDDDLTNSDYHLFLNLNREYNDEEVLFAETADKCPGLESKLINLTYALQQKIISRDEYNNIYDYLNNTIRITNGQLMAYSQSYYLELHKSNKAVTKYTNAVDHIGAIMNHLITLYGEKSSVDEEVLNEFDTLYTEIFKTGIDINLPDNLINRNELVTDYYNKTFDANQRFFKSIKQFRDFFESHDNFTANTNTQYLTDYILTAEYPDESNLQDQYYYSFQTNEIESIYETIDNQVKIKNLVYSSGLPKMNVTLYTRIENEYTTLPLAVPDFLQNIYVLQNPQLRKIEANSKYNKNLLYFVPIDEYKEEFGNKIDEQHNIITHLNKKYVELNTYEISRFILKNKKDHYYIRRTNVYTPFDGIRYPVPQNSESTFEPLKNTTFKEKMSIPQFLTNKELTNLDYYRIYATSIPIDFIYYYGEKYKVCQDNETQYTERYNQFNYNTTQWNELGTDYQQEHQGEDNLLQDFQKQYGSQPKDTFLFQQIPFVSNIPVKTSKDFVTLEIDNYLDNIKNVTDALIYYSASYNKDMITIAKNTGITSLVTYFLCAPVFVPTLITSITYTVLARQKKHLQGLSNSEPRYLFEPTISYQDSHYIFEPSTDDTLEKDGFYDRYGALFAKTADSFTKMEQNTLIGQYGPNQDVGPIKLKTTDNILTPNNKYFFNYYSLIAATYSFEYESPFTTKNSETLKSLKPAYTESPEENQKNYHLWLKNQSYSRIITNKDSIYKYDKYYLILLDTEEGLNSSNGTLFKDGKQPQFSPLCDNDQIDLNKYPKFSNIQYYWLPKVLLDLTIIPEDAGTEDLISIEDMKRYGQGTPVANYNFIFQKDVSNTTWTFLLVHDEPYESVLLGDNSIHIDGNNYIIDYKTGKNEPLYNLQTHAPVQLLNENLPVNLYILNKEEVNYRPAVLEDLQDLSIRFFGKNELGDYQRTYSIQQIQDNIKKYNEQKESKEPIYLIPLYFKNNRYYKKTYLDKTRNKFLVNLYAHHIQYNEDHTKILSHEQVPVYNYELNFKDEDTVVVDQDKKYTTTIRLTVRPNTTYSFKNLTNGELWYQYHNTKISPSILEQTNLIEAQLNQFWNTAVLASKMGNYFLPDSGKPSDNNQTNIGSDLLGIRQNNTIKLSYNLVPEVVIYKTDYNDQFTEILPKYHFVYSNEDKIENTTGIQLTESFFQNNPAYQHHKTINTINSSNPGSNGHVEANGTCTYYYLKNENQGVLGKKVLLNTILDSSNKQSKDTYEFFDGWYPMMYKIFMLRFGQEEQLEYITLQKRKLEQGTKLYKAYPNIFLEKSYTNENATTSKELLEMAKLAFKDQLKPEEAYNLTVLDIASIQGYQGEELQLGDSIQLDTESLYNNFDSTYNSLNKFLFITDISYDLRKDTDIQLTVNTIKYQEKLLQQLVKLIR